MGLPVLTCAGTTFAGRVAASLLKAGGMPELVTASLEEYEKLGLRLAQDKDALGILRARLARNKDAEALFDTQRFTRHLEAAYTAMVERRERGEPPTHFSVARMG
jgi:protein O-GlcNAc transferase